VTVVDSQFVIYSSQKFSDITLTRQVYFTGTEVPRDQATWRHDACVRRLSTLI